MITWIGWLLCGMGMFFLLVAAIGIVRLPDALTRQHAVTKAGTVAVSLFAAGVAGLAGDGAWTGRLVILVILLLLTLPMGSHALSRAALASDGGECPHRSDPKADLHPRQEL